MFDVEVLKIFFVIKILEVIFMNNCKNYKKQILIKNMVKNKIGCFLIENIIYIYCVNYFDGILIFN